MLVSVKTPVESLQISSVLVWEDRQTISHTVDLSYDNSTSVLDMNISHPKMYSEMLIILFLFAYCCFFVFHGMKLNCTILKVYTINH